MAFTITWHEFDARHHSGDLSTDKSVVKGAVLITLQGGEGVFDVFLKGKKFKSKPQIFTDLKTLKIAAEYFLFSACTEEMAETLPQPNEHDRPTHKTS